MDELMMNRKSTVEYLVFPGETAAVSSEKPNIRTILIFLTF